MNARQRQKLTDLRELIADTERKEEALRARKEQLQQQLDALLAEIEQSRSRRAA